MPFGKKTIATVLAAGCIGTSAFLYLFRVAASDDDALQTKYEQITDGMSTREIESILGRPCDEVRNTEAIHPESWWYGDEISIVVASEGDDAWAVFLVHRGRPRPPTLFDQLRELLGIKRHRTSEVAA
jgi:hypothetical protein